MVWALVFFGGQISGSFLSEIGWLVFSGDTARGWTTGATPNWDHLLGGKLWQRYLLLACPQNLETVEWHLCWFLLGWVVFVSHNPSRRIIILTKIMCISDWFWYNKKTRCWSKMWCCPLTGRYASEITSPQRSRFSSGFPILKMYGQPGGERHPIWRVDPLGGSSYLGCG